MEARLSKQKHEELNRLRNLYNRKVEIFQEGQNKSRLHPRGQPRFKRPSQKYQDWLEHQESDIKNDKPKISVRSRSEHTPQQVKHFQSVIGQLSAGYRNNNPPDSHYGNHPIPHEQKLAAHAFPEEQYEHLRSKTENWSRAIFDKNDDTTPDAELRKTNEKETVSSGSTHTVDSMPLNVFLTEDDVTVESLEDEEVTESGSIKSQTDKTTIISSTKSERAINNPSVSTTTLRRHRTRFVHPNLTAASRPPVMPEQLKQWLDFKPNLQPKSNPVSEPNEREKDLIKRRCRARTAELHKELGRRKQTPPVRVIRPTSSVLLDTFKRGRDNQ